MNRVGDPCHPLALCIERSHAGPCLGLLRKRQSHPRKVRGMAGTKTGAGGNPEGKYFLLMSVRKSGKVFCGIVISKKELFIGYNLESHQSPWRSLHSSAQESGSQLWVNIWYKF